MKYIAILILFSSCYGREDINCKYRGAVVQDKFYGGLTGHCYYTIKYNARFKTMRVYEIDSDYEVGDTINKPCIK